MPNFAPNKGTIIMEANYYRHVLRGKIIKTAASMFMDKGVKSVKMDDIAQSLSISKRTLYEIFSDKETLLLEVVTTLDADFSRKVQKMAAESSDVMEILYHFYTMIISQLNKFNPVFLDDVGKYPTVVEKIERGTENKHQAFVKFAKRGISEGFFLPGIDYGLVEEFIDMSSREMKVRKMPQKYGLKKTFITTSIMLLRGVCTEKGIKRFDEIIAEQL